jgi:RecA-family ATPase
MPLNVEHASALIVATEDSKEKFTSAIMRQAYRMNPNLKPKDVHVDFTEGSEFDDFLLFKSELEGLLKKKFYDLIIIDALSDLFTLIDGEINSNSHARKILSFFQAVCNQYQTTIIIIHHAAKSKIVAKRKEGKLFVEKGDSQGAGAITQKPRTVLALSSDPKSVSEDGFTYTNYLHVVKANLMGKHYLKNAIVLKFDSRILMHFPQGTVDIELFSPEMPIEPGQSELNPKRKTTPQEMSLQEHKDLLKVIFRAGGELLKAELIEGIRVHYNVGKNLIEKAGGFLPYLRKVELVERTPYGFKFNPHAVPDGWQQPNLNNGNDDEVPF